eukprot:893627-Amphidinium_carterae.1
MLYTVDKLSEVGFGVCLHLASLCKSAVLCSTRKYGLCLLKSLAWNSIDFRGKTRASRLQMLWPSYPPNDHLAMSCSLE